MGFDFLFRFSDLEIWVSFDSSLVFVFLFRALLLLLKLAGNLLCLRYQFFEKFDSFKRKLQIYI